MIDDELWRAWDEAVLAYYDAHVRAAMQWGRENFLQGQNASWLNVSVTGCLMNEGINHN
jgi:hypothetical protein